MLIRNVLKSPRRKRGDHTVLMNRDRRISSNLCLHFICPSVHTLPLPLFLPPFNSLYKVCFPFSYPLFVFQPQIIFVRARNSLIIFNSLPPPPFPLSSFHSHVFQWCQFSIRQLCSCWLGWRPGTEPCSECLAHPSAHLPLCSLIFLYQLVIK